MRFDRVDFIVIFIASLALSPRITAHFDVQLRVYVCVYVCICLSGWLYVCMCVCKYDKGTDHGAKVGLVSGHSMKKKQQNNKNKQNNAEMQFFSHHGTGVQLQ